MSTIISLFALVGIDITTTTGCYTAMIAVLALIVILSLRQYLSSEG